MVYEDEYNVGLPLCQLNISSRTQTVLLLFLISVCWQSRRSRWCVICTEIQSTPLHTGYPCYLADL